MEAIMLAWQPPRGLDPVLVMQNTTIPWWTIPLLVSEPRLVYLMQKHQLLAYCLAVRSEFEGLTSGKDMLCILTCRCQCPRP